MLHRMGPQASLSAIFGRFCPPLPDGCDADMIRSMRTLHAHLFPHKPTFARLEAENAARRVHPQSHKSHNGR